MNILRTDFGKMPDGRVAHLYTLTSANGLMAKITNYGGIVTELHVPDRDGHCGNVVLGFDSLKPYVAEHPYFGAIIGRVANRIGGAAFELEGKNYQLAANDKSNTLHGGKVGFNRVVWDAQMDSSTLRLRYHSPDGEEGFPGALDVTVCYMLTDDNALRIEYQAASDHLTPVNLTNHSYFNLRGPGSGDVLQTQLQIAAEYYTPVNEALIPTGHVAPVAGTPLDFTNPKAIGRDLAAAGGYDHNLILRTGGDELLCGARAKEPQSGRVMEMWTTEPAVQLYTGNFLDGSLRGLGGSYHKYGAFCLEAQHYPDSVNRPNFPSTLLVPGQTYRQTTLYRFSTL